MTPKKQPVKKEPFLNAVARKLGHAAGTLTHVAQGLTETLSALPNDASTTKPAKAAPDTAAHPQPKKRSGQASAKRGKKRVAGAAKRKPAARKSLRRTASINRNKISRKKK
jgi:hypothetical protein